MAHARISMYLPPDIDPTKAAIAYGCRALPKLNEELNSEDLLTRQKALMALCDLMHDPEYVYEAINLGFLESLKSLLKDNDDLVRIKTTEVLCIMATHNVGRNGFLENDVILALSFLMNDPYTLCRQNLHQAFKHLAQLPSGAHGIVDSGLITPLVWKLQREEENIQELILDTLAFCLQEDATEALSSCAVPFLKQKLVSDNKDICSKAARALIAISIPLEGKNQVWKHDVIPLLVQLLKDKDKEVQANAAGALMYATVTTEGSCLPYKVKRSRHPEDVCRTRVRGVRLWPPNSVCPEEQSEKDSNQVILEVASFDGGDEQAPSIAEVDCAEHEKSPPKGMVALHGLEIVGEVDLSNGMEFSRGNITDGMDSSACDSSSEDEEPAGHVITFTALVHAEDILTDPEDGDKDDLSKYVQFV